MCAHVHYTKFYNWSVLSCYVCTTVLMNLTVKVTGLVICITIAYSYILGWFLQCKSMLNANTMSTNDTEISCRTY